jgi:hypothetical protein
MPHEGIVPPQPSAHGPQLMPVGHVVAGVHVDVGFPQAFATPPPPHVVPLGHDGHETVPPQPSPTVPH